MLLFMTHIYIHTYIILIYYGYTGGPQKSSRFSQVIISLLIELGILNISHWKVYTFKFIYDTLIFSCRFCVIFDYY